MTKKELKQIQKEASQQSLGIYAGILFNNQTFIEGNDDEIVYNFDYPEFITLKDKYIGESTYICKNLFYFYIDKDSTFGKTGNTLAFVPINYSVKAKDIANAKYRINHLPEEYKDWKCDLEKRLENLINYPEIERTNINSMVKSPIK